MRDELTALDTRRNEADEHAPEPLDETPLLHPGLGELDRRKVADLTTALNDEGLRTEAAALLRGLVAGIRLVPQNGELVIESKGELAAILALGAEAKRPRAAGGGLGRFVGMASIGGCGGAIPTILALQF